MHFLFVLIKVYPVVAITAAVVCLQFAIHFKRQKKRKPLVAFLLALFFLVSSALAWVYYRGDLHADRWLKSQIGTFFPIE